MISTYQTCITADGVANMVGDVSPDFCDIGGWQYSKAMLILIRRAGVDFIGASYGECILSRHDGKSPNHAAAILSGGRQS